MFFNLSALYRRLKLSHQVQVMGKWRVIGLL